jgi:tetratricopeptide (TPR) repeat protein
LPHLFVADVLQKAHPFSGMGMSDAGRDTLNRERLDELSKAISLEPNLVPALEDRASLYLDLKQHAQAIADFDRVTTLDPNEALALNDRGVTKMQTGDFYGAIFDFTSAIAHKERALQNTNSYESRADAYIKTLQWALALNDITTGVRARVRIRVECPTARPLQENSRFRLAPACASPF